MGLSQEGGGGGGGGGRGIMWCSLIIFLLENLRRLQFTVPYIFVGSSGSSTYPYRRTSLFQMYLVRLAWIVIPEATSSVHLKPMNE